MQNYAPTNLRVAAYGQKQSFEQCECGSVSENKWSTYG